jgi:dienelactone hydrolase
MKTTLRSPYGTSVAFLILAGALLRAQTPDPSFAPIQEAPNLPRVLLIGDSISMGYTLPVRELLKDKANVVHPPENCGETARGLAKLDAWLGDKKWDAIHFNFGLHDLKYLDAAGKYVTPDKGKQVALLPEYEANLRQIVARLKKTGAKLIWASTTPVPDGSQGRVQGDEGKYNEVALKVMREAGIPVDDLHAIAVEQQPHNVHFTQEGYRVLARAVAASVERELVYEEDLQLSRPYRDENYRQFTAYSAALRFQKMIGYPAPGFFDRAQAPRIVKAGEDAIGTYYRVWIAVAPGMETYGLYIVPKNAKLPAPLVISLHGGGGIPESALFHGGSNYHDQIRGAVQRGYVVWAPLFVMMPFADREKGTMMPAEVRRDLDADFRKLGTSLMGVEATKITRALDRILERPEVDPARVAMIGLSYGGYYTLYISAVEPRVKVAIASCSFRNTPAAKDGVTEGRPIDITSPEQVALVAPRPLQIQVGLTDPQAPIDTVRVTAVEARKAYERSGKLELFDYQEFQGGHEWRGDIAWAFLAKHL